MADEESRDARGEEAEAVRDEEDVARAAEQLRGDEESDLPVIGHVPAQKESQRGGGKKRQEGRFHGIGQVRPLDASDEIQDAGDQEKGAGNVPDGVFTHFDSRLSPAS